MSVSKPFPAPGTLPYYAPLKEWADDVEAQVDDETIRAKIVHLAVGVRTADGYSLPEGTMVVLTIDKTLAQITADPTADIADITFEETV